MLSLCSLYWSLFVTFSAGLCNYYNLSKNGKTSKMPVWYYADPLPAAADIKGRIAFWQDVSVEEAE